MVRFPRLVSHLVFAAALAALGCSTVASSRGECASDADCAGGVCDRSGAIAMCTTTDPGPGPMPMPMPMPEPMPMPADPVFPGFEATELFVGAYWEYEVTSESSSSGGSSERTSAVVRIELVRRMDVPFEGLVIPFFEAEGSLVSGSLPDAPAFKYYNYYAFLDGIVLVGGYLESGAFDFGILFDPISGRVADAGAMGYFSASREERIYAGTFQGRTAVIVDEPFRQPQCETISGVRVCGEESHDYEVREYYSPGVGFAGFHRSGTSVFSGGGYTTIHSSRFDIAIARTNLGAR